MFSSIAVIVKLSPISIASSYDRLIQLTSSFPRGAITESWLQVETTIQEAAHVIGMEPASHYRAWKQVLTELIKQEKIPKETIYLFDDLRIMRNKATHEIDFDISSQQAASYIDLAMGLVYQIQTAIRE